MTHPHRRRAAKAALVAAAASILLAGCVGPDENATGGGGTAVIALIQEPGVLSPMFSTQSGSDVTEAFVTEPMFAVLADGSHEPFIAEEIPTVENGGVSEDGLTITMKVRDGVTWSDGEPLTADDLAFTVEVAQNPDGAAFPPPEYAAIESTEVVDDQTIELHLGQPLPSYLSLFDQVLPEHMFESSAVQLEDPQARLPLGTGPFVYEEWASGSQITLAANEDYWRDPDLPELDRIVLQITPDKESAVAGFTNGDYDMVFFLTSGDLAGIQTAVDEGAPITLEVPERIGSVEWLWLNHSDNGDLATPHPVLGDLAVRQAIDAAIDRESIIDDVLGGFGSTTGSMLYAGFGATDREATAYDPDAAAAILDEAGWGPGADGIRERDGVRASLRFQTISGDQVRVLYQQLIQQQLKDVGIEVVIENVPSNTLFDSRSQGGLLANGDFDIAMSRDGLFEDPAIWIDVFTSGVIPSAENDAGFSYSHWVNPEFDALAAEAASTADLEARAAVLAEIDELFVTEVVAIPVYASPVGIAYSSNLTGVTYDYWDSQWTTLSSANWSLAGN